MPLATKNGAIIIKDGKLAESCGCCGGWYCCFSPECAADSISSVSVTITASDYLQWTRTVPASGSGIPYNNTSVGFLGSAYAGTFSLVRQPNGSTWKKAFTPSPHSTCVADLTFTIDNTRWSLTFRYSLLGYGSFTESADYKELSQMVCRGLPDINAGYPLDSGPQASQVVRGFVGECSSLINISNTLTFQALFPPLPFSGTSFSRVVVREEGDYMATIGLSVTQ
jgi:hypothetical protein